jgi:hypothetical protein
MSKSLKQKNQPQIVTLLIINVLALSAVIPGWNAVTSFIAGAINGNFGLLGKGVAVPAVCSLLLGVAGWSLPRGWKEALVFWRVGETCLPSSRTFTKLIQGDPRIDVVRLSSRLGQFPTEPSKQSALWYQMYRRHREEASVEDANGAYLRYREMTAVIAALIIATLPVTLWQGSPWRTSLTCHCLLMAEYMFLMLAARNAATHLVTNVVAIESSRD